MREFLKLGLPVPEYSWTKTERAAVAMATFFLMAVLQHIDGPFSSGHGMIPESGEPIEYPSPDALVRQTSTRFWQIRCPDGSLLTYVGQRDPITGQLLVSPLSELTSCEPSYP